MKKKKYKILLSYDGTPFCGWQVQKNGVSIQKTLQNALEMIVREEIELTGCSRTDAGVHALGQVAHFSTSKEIQAEKLLFSLNSVLPQEIRVFSIEEVEKSFHARYSAIKKTYEYHFSVCRFLLPFDRLYIYRLPSRVNLDRMKEGCKEFVGTHDFTSFSNEPHRGACARNPIKTLHQVEILEKNDHQIVRLTGNGFLYKMVRNIVGTLIDLGKGKIDLGEIGAMFAAHDRKTARSTAPAHGLFLVSIDYEKESSTISSKEGK